MLLKCLVLFTFGCIQINLCNGSKERADGLSKRRQQLPHQNQQQIYSSDAYSKHYNHHQQIEQQQQQFYKDFEINQAPKRSSFQRTLKNRKKLKLNYNSKRRFKRNISTNPFLQRQMSQNPFVSNPFLPNPKPTNADQERNVLLINQSRDDTVRKPSSQINGTTHISINQNLFLSNDIGINNTSASAIAVHFTTQATKLSPELSQLVENEAVIFPDSQYLSKTTQNPQEALDIKR
uniref:Uncharacterized protein n=1 Tax=Ceratitis capitata TaxID=7213 RepID=W8C9J3_CERCA